MKILYLITQSELGGAQSYVLDLVKKLDSKYDIVVAFGKQNKTGKLIKKLKATNAKYYTLPHLIRNISPWHDILATIEIINLTKRIKPDIIHLNSSKISILGSLAGVFCKLFVCKKKVKLLYTVHGWVFNEPIALWRRLFYKYLEKFSSPIKEKLICVSNYDRNIAIKNHVAPPEKLITIHNGRENINFLTRLEARNKLQNALRVQKIFSKQNLSNKEIIIGTIANFYKTKGYKYFLSAISRLIIEGNKLKVIAIGEGPERKNIEKLIKAYRLENNFLLAGRMDGAELLKAFDIYVCSSVKEGLSYTIIEAMQAGLPIIATKVGGNPELITNGVNGKIIASKNSESLAKEIADLLHEPEFGRLLGENAQQKAIKDFGLNRMVKLTEEVYLS